MICQCCKKREVAGLTKIGGVLYELTRCCRQCYIRQSDARQATGEFWGSKKGAKS